ncbi:MAG: hypothetical protein HN846_04565 [Candidatus Pacebacteria bacterium]|jgi:hypothetical protein|nr:hypothetical protein [Candidatus Paceibacterota bacterium]MBT3512215.1 hypothetical protein [Candidatus Paceibacterota bacterium]MBT4004555.1 hypothetical protein [Candidatus Paceibacterota bacterium]MBT4359197.1 hypothetical protein [Candidatus Paceibacterota bacterium]MBT4681083.1 hypothetical protein [Candidatus Paceibacterota bacterium]
MSDFFSNKLNRYLLAYFLLLTVYTVFSYSLTAPNLVLTSWSPYWKFQNWMWEAFFNNRQLLTYSYLALIGLIFTNYFLVLKSWPKNKKLSWWLPLLITSPLIFSNNALSHDVFNYIFNAKMVVVYQANPHLQTALDFATDNWTRFMHNTHTPAPYFYGWTGLSLLPYALGGGKFSITWLVFRLFSFLSLGLLSFSMIKNIKKQNIWLLGLLFNPLLLIEVVSNAHNDLWMMAPALVAMLVVSGKKTNKKIFVSLALLLFSASVKLATLALLPVWLALVLPWRNIWPKLNKFILTNWPFLTSVLLFLPLLTPRSKQFLPWYLIWSLVWLPLIGKKWQAWKTSLLVLSISSMLRYLPYIWKGNYEGNVQWQQLLITWMPFILFWIIHFTHRKLASRGS